MELSRTIQITTNTRTSTEGTYVGFNLAFSFFNDHLFGGMLPECLITLQRSKRSRGYFSRDRFGHRRSAEIVDEIALNPATFIGRTDKEIISTLVHEMCHLWQAHFGKPGRGGYHNKEWAAKMRELGLVPSQTGEPGGKQTGQRVTHYIKDGGPYDTEWRRFASLDYTLDYQDQIGIQSGEQRKVKVRYACPVCAIHVWGKPDLRLACLNCSEPMA